MMIQPTKGRGKVLMGFLPYPRPHFAITVDGHSGNVELTAGQCKELGAMLFAVGCAHEQQPDRMEFTGSGDKPVATISSSPAPN